MSFYGRLYYFLLFSLFIVSLFFQNYQFYEKGGSVFSTEYSIPISSVQFSRLVVSNSFRLHELQHTRPPCPSPTPGIHPNSCPSNQWCHPAISSSVVPFSSCPQSLPASESFPMSQLFTWGDQSTGISALASFFPKNTQGWSPLEWPFRYDLNQIPYDWLYSGSEK